MLNPNLLLKSQSPTPSTVLYTVTSSPPRLSLLSRSIYILTAALRITFAFVLTALLLALLYGHKRLADLAWPQDNPDAQAFATVLTWLQDICNPEKLRYWWAAVAACIVGLWAVSRRGYVEESILFIRELGIQMSTSSPAYFGSPSTRFIPMSQVRDFFIHEAFKGFEVRFYLAVIVEGEGQATVVFPKLLPRLGILEEVWRGGKKVLYQEDK